MHNAEVILITAKDSAGLDAYRGKLAGKIIITDRTDTYKLSFKPDASAIQMKNWILWQIIKSTGRYCCYAQEEENNS